MSLQKALALHKQGRFDMAEEEYLQALNSEFDNLDTLYLLGTVYLQRGKIGLAASLYKLAIMLKKDHFEAWNNLGNCYKAINKEQDAKKCWETALAIKGKTDVDYADLYNNLGTLYVNAGEPETGLGYLEKALALTPGHVDANWNKALLLLEQGKFEEGFRLYHWGFNMKQRPDRQYGKEIPYWNGEEGKNIVVWGEQGLGDEILFSVMIPELQKISKSVVFECHPRLVKLFKNSFPGVHIYGTRKDTFINWVQRHPDINARVAIGDLGRWFRKDVSAFPKHEGYLKASEERITHYRKKLAKISGRLKVGISWTGGYVKTRKDFRSIPLIQWEPILRQDADFISLQYTPEAYNTIAEVEEALDVRIHHWPSAVTEGVRVEYHETAALVSALDLVITINTSVHHLTGALGKPIWTLTPKAKAWRYWTDENGKFPWYPSARCIEQPKVGLWPPVLAQTAGELSAFIAAKKDGEKVPA